jgi:hypothetical protein
MLDHGILDKIKVISILDHDLHVPVGPTRHRLFIGCLIYDKKLVIDPLIVRHEPGDS